MLNYHRERFRKLTFRALALRQSGKSLVEIQVYAMFRAGDIRRNVLLKFIRLCMETPCLCPFEGNKYSDRKLKKHMSNFSRTRTVQIAKSQRISHSF